MSSRRTRAPRNGVISTMPSASSPRRASRTGAWLVPSSLATAVSTIRESGGYEPSRIPSSSRSLTWSASTLRVRPSGPDMATSTVAGSRGSPAGAGSVVRHDPGTSSRRRGRGGPDRLEPAHVLGERHLGREPLHARGTEEADDADRARQDVLRVVRFGDGAAVAEDDDVGVDRD